jgi:hypothetical protein
MLIAISNDFKSKGLFKQNILEQMKGNIVVLIITSFHALNQWFSTRQAVTRIKEIKRI